ncbi:hypothetical protein [Phenylobacterium sp.]|jgi:hypothetical protein|uniref:hypothetical protein n=1 Tax=Phenylobacterium sp. TaxID=1871053 RepID=UPI002F409088
MAAAALAGSLAGCHGKPAPPQPLAPKGETSADAGYIPAPSLDAAESSAGGVRLQGTAQPRARVRLAPPSGEALFAPADGRGRWRIVLPVAPGAWIFGLSMAADGRQVQAQGYVLVTASGRAAVLRAGAGAIVLGPPAPPRLTAVDFDRQGGAVVSGLAGPQAAVSVRVDGRPGAVGRADAGGRFSLALPQPLTPGSHQVEIVGDAFTDTVAVDATPATALSGGPFRATAAAGGLRADWMTPGGGVQSTWILN